MNALTIRHLQHRSHIRGPASSAVRRRIDSALATMLDDELDAAMLAAGIDLEEEVCIRRMHMRGNLNLRRSDAQLATDLSLTWVDELRQTIERGGPDVVRYRSRAHALLDMAIRVASVDGSRAWAWQQLGLWPREFDISSPRAIELLKNALTHNITAVVPTLVGVARQGLLSRLVRRLLPVQMDSLAAAALEAAQLPATLIAEEPPSSESKSKSKLAAAPEIAVITAAVRGALRRSPLAVAVTEDLASRTAVQRSRATAILVLLAAEPALLRTSEAGIYIEKAVDALGRQSAELRNAPERTDASSQIDRSLRRESQSETVAVEDSKRATKPPSRIDASRARSTEAPKMESSFVSTESTRAPRTLDSHEPNDRCESGKVIENVAAECAPSEASAPPQQSTRYEARTEWGGLLFLLSLIEPSGVLESATTDVVLQARGLRWVLHRLAAALLPIELNDACAYAFSATHPLDAQQMLDSSEPSIGELNAIAALAEKLAAYTAQHLGDTASRDFLLHTVCHRTARLFFDPGWIEARFALDSASIDIRRSGLDRDPDWLPWLGAVVRFVYE